MGQDPGGGGRGREPDHPGGIGSVVGTGALESVLCHVRAREVERGQVTLQCGKGN